MRAAFKILIYLSIPIILSAQDNIPFDAYFTNQTMRIDYFHTGDADEEIIIMDQIYQEPFWSGTRSRLIHPIDLGKYRYTVHDKRSKQLIYTQTYDTYFGEYQTTKPARNGIFKSYHESALIPFPKDSILFAIERRDKTHQFHSIFELVIDPADYHIIQGESAYPSEIFEIQVNGPAHSQVNVVILGEGYTEEQKSKFHLCLMN